MTPSLFTSRSEMTRTMNSIMVCHMNWWYWWCCKNKRETPFFSCSFCVLILSPTEEKSCGNHRPVIMYQSSYVSSNILILHRLWHRHLFSLFLLQAVKFLHQRPWHHGHYRLLPSPSKDICTCFFQETRTLRTLIDNCRHGLSLW